MTVAMHCRLLFDFFLVISLFLHSSGQVDFVFVQLLRLSEFQPPLNFYFSLNLQLFATCLKPSQ